MSTRPQWEESGDVHLVMAIWKSVLGQEQALWDHDVLECVRGVPELTSDYIPEE